MKLPLLFSGAFLVPCFFLTSNVFASLSIDSLNSPIVINFNGFNGSGFSPTPSEGQLDSDSWAVDGLFDGTLNFGATQIGNDFARGSDPDAVGPGGIYAFDTGGGNVALGIQPGGADWVPGSFTLRMQNNTGATLTSLELSYSVFVYNDQNRSNSFNFSHSSDNSLYMEVGSLDFESPELLDDPSIWVETEMEATLTGLSITNGSSYYFRWSGDDFSGIGGRDQFALDNISVSAVPEPAHFGLICGLIMLFLIGRRVRAPESN